MENTSTQTPGSTSILSKRLLLTFLTVMMVLSGYAATITSTGNGNWNNPAIWSGGVVPTAADNVTISAGNTITVNAAGAVAGSITITGTLALNGAGVTVDGPWTNNGTFNCGNNAANIVTFGTGGSIGGSATTTFYGLAVNTTAATDKVTVTAATNTVIIADGGSVNLTNGIFKVGAANNITYNKAVTFTAGATGNFANAADGAGDTDADG